MKKRLISILLSVLMIASLFTGIGVTAHAETVAYNTMTYRMQSGDYVLRICQRLGLNYYICKPAIMKLNNITDNQWRFLPVGKLLTLPATDADAVVVNTGKGSTITAAPATTAVASTIAAATPTASTTTTSASASGDIIWWWIVPYELRSGETITDAMNSLGVSFSQYARTIQVINQIKNWGAARTDTSILLPTVYPPLPGYSRVTVYKHIMRAGETPASVVAARGLNYNNIKPMLEIVNDMYDSLADIMTGQPFYYPIASDGKVMGKDRTDGMYGLYSGLSSANGTVEFYVDGQRVYEAKAGSTVKYVLKPAKDQAVKSVTLKFANGQADMLLTGDSFTMPSTDVTLDAAFQSGHKITVKSNYEGKAVARVDGISVSGAAKGATVMVSSTDASLAIDELYVNYKTFTGEKREAVTNIDQGFVMPDYDVVIEAVLKPVPTYAFFVDDEIANGSFSLQIDGAKVTRAARGAEVKIVAEPDKGYTISSIEVKRHGTTDAINVFNNTFTMPNCDVDVKVTFDLAAGNRILINPVQGGEFWATVGAAGPKSDAVKDAKTNTNVYINGAADANYAVSTEPDDYIVTRSSDGLRVKVYKSGSSIYFKMPAGGATITGAMKAGGFKYALKVFLDGTEVNQKNFVTVYAKGDKAAERSEFPSSSKTDTEVGEYIALSYESAETISLVRYEVWKADGSAKLTEESNQVKVGGGFTMPAEDVEIHAYFSASAVKVAAKDVKVTGSGTVGVLDKDGNSAEAIKAGEPFALTVSPSKGFHFDPSAVPAAKISATRKDNKAEVALDPSKSPNPEPGADGEYIFYFEAMPECGINVEVTFDTDDYVLELKAEDEKGKPLTGAGLWSVTVNQTETIIENNTSTVNAKYGDYVTVALTEAGKSKYTFVATEINGKRSTKTSFWVNSDNSTGTKVPVTLILKPAELSQGAIDLSAYYDTARGSVGFVILDSKSGYSTPDKKALVQKAYAGDKVGIVATPIGEANELKDENVWVDLWDGSQLLTTPEDIDVDGKTVRMYTFIMPETNFRFAHVEFQGKEYNLIVTAKTVGGNTPSKGLFQVTYYDWTTQKDVLLSDSFQKAPAGTSVTITNTYSGITIKSISGVGAAESLYPAAGPSGSFTFKMPNKDVNIELVLSNYDDTTKDDKVPTGEPDPTPISLPATVTLTKPDDSTVTKTLQYYDAEGHVIGDKTANSGTIVKVEIVGGLDEGMKLDGGIQIKDVDKQYATAEDGGTFEVPYTTKTLTAEAKISPKQFKVTFTASNAKPDNCSIKVDVKRDGSLVNTFTVQPGMTLANSLVYDDILEIDASAGERNISEVKVNGTVSGTTSVKTASGVEIKPAGVEDGATVPVNIDFEVPTHQMPSSCDKTYTVRYYSKSGANTADQLTSPFDEDSTVYVVSDCVAGDYVTEIKITDNDGDVQTLSGNDQPYTVKADVSNPSQIVVSTAKKTVSVKVVSKYKDGTDATDRVEVTGPVTGVEKGDVVNIKALNDATISITGSNFTQTDVIANEEIDCEIDTSAVENGSEVTIEVEVTKPLFQLKDGSLDSQSTTKYFYDAEMKKPVDSSLKVTEGEQIYIKATPVDDARYVTGVAIYGSTLTKQSSGAYGPYTITEDMTYNPAVDTADKVITLQFDFKDGAQSEVEVRFNGAAQVDWATSGVSNVTNSGERKISLITLDIKASSTKEFKVVSSTNGSAPLVGTPPKQATFSPNWIDLENGDTLTYTVYVG